MTREQVLSLDHLAVAEVTVFMHLHTEDGWILTNWSADEDIKEYSGSECYYMPIRDEYKDFRIITVEEHNELEKQRDEEIEKENGLNKENE